MTTLLSMFKTPQGFLVFCMTALAAIAVLLLFLIKWVNNQSKESGKEADKLLRSFNKNTAGEGVFIMFHIENLSNQKQRTGFLIEKKINPQVKVVCDTSYCDFYDYIKNFSAYLTLVKVYSQNKDLATRVFYWTRNNLRSKSSGTLLIPANDISLFQYQADVIEKQTLIDLDGVTEDIEFTLMPCEKISIALRIQSKEELIDSNLDFDVKNVSCGAVIENNSNETKRVALFDLAKYLEYEDDKELVITNLFDGIEYKAVCEYFSGCDLQKEENSDFNNIRIFGVNCKTESFGKNIKFGTNGLSVYQRRPNQFIDNAIDINFSSPTSFKDGLPVVEVLPNTKVVYIFQTIDRLQNG